LGLLRRELFRENSSTSGFTTPKAQTTKYSDVLWKSVTFVSILFDCWFSVADNRLQSKSLSSFGQFSQAGVGTFPTSNLARSNATISSVVAVVNRTLVEHLHHFVYGPSSSIIDAQFRDFKERHVPKLLSGRMWIFLQYAFDKWPLDSSFRLLMELWLAYIQPWRYAYGDYQSQGERNFDGHWEIFVKEHLGFYTTFFRAALERFMRMDLAACKNAFILYRLAHVISQPNLAAVLGWMDVGYVSSIHANDLDGQFRLEVGKLVIAVTERAREALKYCQRQIAQQKNAERKKTWTSWFLSLWAEDEEPSHLAELDRARECLDVAIQHFQHAFGFRLSEEPLNGNILEENFNAPFQNEKEPDCQQDDDGRLRLTPLGRHQLLNANRRFDLSRVPRPSDLMLIDSASEIGFFSRFLIMVSSMINARYGRQFEILYRQPRGFIPWIFRKLLEPPTRVVRRNSPVIERRPAELKARINLRPLASYRFLLKFWFLLIFFGLFFGFSTVMVALVVILLVCIAWIYFVLEYHPRVRIVD